eukprot:327059_1
MALTDYTYIRARKLNVDHAEKDKQKEKNIIIPNIIHGNLNVNGSVEQLQHAENKTNENNTDTVCIQTHVCNSLISTNKLLNLANQLKSNGEFQKELSTSSYLIAEYTTGDETNNSSTQSNHSGESKHNSDENSDNSNDDNPHDEKDKNHDDSHDDKDNNNHPNEDHKCKMDKYDCNVSWHAVRLKQLEKENKRLKLLLQKQTT